MFASSQHQGLLAAAFGSVVDGVVVVGGKDRRAYLNPACREMLAHLVPSEERLYLDHILALPFQHLDGSPLLAEESPLNRALTGETIVDCQLAFTKPGGIPVFVSVNANSILSEQGLLLGAIAIFRDVTDNRLAEEALRQSEVRFRTLAENASDIVYRYRIAPTRGFDYVNPAVMTVTGYSPAEYYADPNLVFETSHPDDRHLIEALAFSSANGGPLLLRSTSKDGRPLWIEHRILPIKDDGGNVVALQGFARDVTADKRAEENLKTSEANYRAIFDAANDAIFVHEIETGAIVDVNQKTCEMYGYSPDEIKVLGTEILSSGKPPYTVEDALAWMEKANHGEPQLFEWLARTKSGELFWVEVNLKRAVIGGHDRLLGIVRDISDRKRMVTALRQSEDRFRSVIEQSLDGIILIDEEGKIVEWNQGQERIMGLKRDKVIGRPAAEVHFHALPKEKQTPEKYAYGDTALQDMVKSGQAFWSSKPQEARIQRPDGQTRVIQDLTFPIRTGDRTFICSICRDITDNRQMEEQLSRMRTLEMVGRVAAQVAHDFNNLLGPLVGYPELIKLELPPGHPAIKFCDTMLLAAKQMADINADLLTLGRRVHFNQEPTNLNLMVREVLDQQLPAGNGYLDIELDLADDLSPINGSTVQLFRVFANLLANAREAMPREGVLGIRTANIQVDKEQAHLHHVQPGPFVKLVVSDNGAGIPKENIQRIFEPFFTTKLDSQRRGSGLGLSVVQAIVEDHHGFVTVESMVGVGTKFKVFLPVDQKKVTEKPTEQPSKGSETILIVDDDELLREMFTLILKELGYKVQHVSSGEEAIAFLETRPVDLLILDMVMPGGIDGAETYRQAREIRQGQKALIVSGYAESERVQEALRLGVGKCLPKPLTMDELARAVQKELTHAG